MLYFNCFSLLQNNMFHEGQWLFMLLLLIIAIYVFSYLPEKATNLIQQPILAYFILQSLTLP